MARRMTTQLFRIAAYTAAVILWCASSPAQEQTVREEASSKDCRFEPERGEIAAITSRGEIVLNDGRLLIVADIRLPEGNHGEKAIAAMRGFEGSPIMVNRSPAPDRWGRNRARVRLELDEDFAVFLVKHGFAIADNGDADTLCDETLLKIENEARQKRLGLWRDRAFRPVSAQDIERLSASEGRFILVEGKIESVGNRQRRAYLNFGTVWSEDFTVVISKDIRAAMERSNVSIPSLKGKRVRVRGIVERWGGASIALTAPNMLEILPEIMNANDTDP